MERIETMNDIKVYKPEILARNSELIAWGLAAASVVGIVISGMNSEVPVWAWTLFGLFLFSGVIISFGNWVDRATSIEIASEGVHFRNGLRDVSMRWEEIEYVWEGKGRVGRMVQVLAKDRHFSFTLPSEMKFQGQVKSRVGFPEGETIRDMILDSAGLTTSKDQSNGKVYSR